MAPRKTKLTKQEARPRVRHAAVRSGEATLGDPLENAIARVALERTRAEKALQVLTGKLLEAQEEERKRIGRELHDGLTQQLAVFALELGLLARRAAGEATEFVDSILNLRQRAVGLLDDLRLITHQLHPSVLERLGLVPALSRLCAEFSRHEEILVWFSVEQDMRWVPSDIAICLYRIAQEALRNVVKHSGATEAWVKIAGNRHDIQLSIVDKGRGFHFNTTPKAGLGLVSMKERVQIVQGKINIESAPGKGTMIRVYVPITWKEQRSSHEKKHSKSNAAAC